MKYSSAASQPQGIWASRRDVLRAGTAIGAVGLVGIHAVSAGLTKDGELRPGTLNTFLGVTPENRFVFACPATEIGQGVSTSLAQILGEDLGVPWDVIDVRFAGAGTIYNNPGKNRQSVGQSFSVRGYYPLLRALSGQARRQLEEAAASLLGVPETALHFKAAGISADAGSDGAIVSYYDAAVAAKQKDTQFQLVSAPAQAKAGSFVGKSLPRKDVPEKIEGSAHFASDIILPNMLHAAVTFAPIDGRFADVDVKRLKAQAGVVDAVLIPMQPRAALAALSERWWIAEQSIRTILPETAKGRASSEEAARAVKSALRQTPRMAVGDVAGLEGPWTVEAKYDVPYLAHATMEPMSAVADFKDGACTLYAGTQSQSGAQAAIAKDLGLAPEKVTIKTTYGGGGFGRRWYHDFSILAVRLSERAGRPVKLIYSREADMAADYYRPAAAASFKARLSKDGRIEALDLATSGQSVMEFGRPGRLKGRPDPTSTSGLKDQPYRADNLRVAWHPVESDVPVGVWRSVGHSQNTFFLEAFLDELATAAGQDPLRYRLAHMDGHPRLQAVLKALEPSLTVAAQKREGIGQGFAVAEGYGSYIAQLVEVEVPEPKRMKIRRINCAFDCGRAINPRGVKSQIEGGILYGLSAALWGHVEIRDGIVANDNFHAYPIVNLAQTPPIDVTLVEDAAAPLGGAGEPGVPPLAPALVNAIADATGERIRSLPLIHQGWELI